MPRPSPFRRENDLLDLAAQLSAEEVAAYKQRVLADPDAACREFMATRRKLESAAERANDAAQHLHVELERLLTPKAMLCLLERFEVGDDGCGRCIVAMGGQRRELPVAEGVNLDELADLQPWEYVLVHPAELFVLGVYRNGDLYAQAQGPVATFESYVAQEIGSVIVKRFDSAAEVVTLPPSLRDQPLHAGDRLVLHRDNPALAIAVLPQHQTESKFIIPVTDLTTRFEDLDGLDLVTETVLEELLPRLVHKRIGERFQIEPINGMILSSCKPGMGKTAFVRALARFLHDLGQEQGFDVVLYSIPPCGLKSMWHGEDARLVREEVCGAIQERLRRPRTQPLIILVVFDEVESLGKRAGGNDAFGAYSAVQNDAVQALLAGMDGIQPLKASTGPTADVLWIGMTNRPDMLDDALKRPGRMGDIMLEMPDYSAAAAAGIMSVYCRGGIPWYIDGSLRDDVPREELVASLLAPAVAQIFGKVVLRYTTEGRGTVGVTAGEILAGVHYKAAINRAKKQATIRMLHGAGAEAIGYEDLVNGLLREALTLAAQLDGDRQMLQRQLRLRTPIVRTEVASEQELAGHRFLRVAS